MNYDQLWQSVLGQMEFEVSRANFATWFKHTSICEVDSGIATITVPNAFAKEWLEKKFHKQIIKSLRSSSPEIRNAMYVVSSHAQEVKADVKKKPQTQEVSDEQLEFKEFSVDRETNLNPKHRFDSFIVGTFNEFAHAAAVSLCKNIGSLYNPFFVYGGVGLGKSHLLHADRKSVV